MSKSLWLSFHGPMLLPFILFLTLLIDFHNFNMISHGKCSHYSFMLLRLIFHGPVILHYTLNAVRQVFISFGMSDQFHITIEFMVQLICELQPIRQLDDIAKYFGHSFWWIFIILKTTVQIDYMGPTHRWAHNYSRVTISGIS